MRIILGFPPPRSQFETQVALELEPLRSVRLHSSPEPAPAAGCGAGRSFFADQSVPRSPYELEWLIACAAQHRKEVAAAIWQGPHCLRNPPTVPFLRWLPIHRYRQAEWL